MKVTIKKETGNEFITVINNLIDADIMLSDFLEVLDTGETVIPTMCTLMYTDATNQVQSSSMVSQIIKSLLQLLLNTQSMVLKLSWIP